MNNSTVDAYKSIIDFNKTIITLASGILTGLIAFKIYSDLAIDFYTCTCIGLIVLSIFLSLFAFGGAIQTVKNGTSQPSTIFLTNVGAFSLVIGILMIFALDIQKKSPSIDLMLNQIEQTTSSLGKDLKPDKVKEIHFQDPNYLITYGTDSVSVTVVYSSEKEQVISVN